MLKTGLTGKKEIIVTEDKTALSVGSGLLPVFATPVMITFMELVSSEITAPFLEKGYSTVGINVSVKHISATPVGMTVRFESELLEIDGKRLVFKVSAYDDAGLIGKGTHERFIVNNEKFISKTNEKGLEK